MTYSKIDTILWVNDKERGTHLDRAALPGEDGRLAFVTEEIVFTIGELCAENFGVPFQNLGRISIVVHIRVIDVRPWAYLDS